MKKSVFRVAAVGAVAALLATMSPMMAHAATTPAYDATTDGPIYMMDGTTATAIPVGTQLDWNYGNTVVLSSIPVPATLTDVSTLAFPALPAGSTDYITFIAPQGSERTKSAWKAWSFSSPVAASTPVLLPSAFPGYLGYGAPAAVKAAGGTYSMGIAYMSNNDLTVTKAFYTTINVDAGTGTWTFAEKPSAVVIVNTDVATTTTLAANPTSVDVGLTTTLTATVSASKTVTGNVHFFAGATDIGTVALSSGSATKTVTIPVAGPNTYSAQFVANTVSTGTTTTDTFLASTSSNVTVTGTVPAVQMSPNAPSENVLNDNTKNGATIVYTESATAAGAVLTVAASNDNKPVNTFVYSTTPVFLGQLTVSATGTITVDLSTLPAGTHKLVIVDPTTGDVLGWASFIKTTAAISPSISKTINADVATAGSVPTDGEFSIIDTSGSNVVNLTNPALVNGQSVVSGALGTFKVTDLRQVSKQGWVLKTDVVQFVKGTDTIDASALGITPKAVSNAGTGATAPILGAATVSGSAVYPWNFASLAGGLFSGVSVFNADLVFTAPAAKPAGTYTSTLTLTLISN
jgi:hypothetical protein